MSSRIPLNRLLKKGYGQIVCYPKFFLEEFEKRIMEMKKLGVKALSFTGQKSINNILVQGKGCVGIVVGAYTETSRVALKIKRTDAGRIGMKHEAEMLQTANSLKIGPRLLGFTENLLMMEFIDGVPFLKWLESLETRAETKLRVRKVLKDVLEQCQGLDEVSLDHGELSSASKHILVTKVDKVCIIDFETASINRKVSNVTSVCQYLFMQGKTAYQISEKIGQRNRDNLLAALRTYKKDGTRENFESVLSVCLA